MQCFLTLFLLSLLTLPQGQPINTKSFRPVRHNGLVGYIDQTGKFVIPPKFDEAWDFNEGLAPFRSKNKWGYIDPRGKVIIPAQFYQAMPFSEGLAPVGIFFEGEKIIESRVGETGFIDKTGHVVFKQKFAVAFEFSNGLARVLTLDNKHGYIDKAGNFIESHGSLTEDFFDERALFKTNSNMPGSLTGYLNKNGNVAITPRFSYGENFSEKCACVYENGKAGFIDINGNTIIEFKYEGCGKFSEGLAAARINGKWGYINKTGDFVIQPQFAEAKEFSEDVAIVSLVKNGKCGAIDKTGRLFIQPQYTELSAFRGGIAWVNLTEYIVVDGEPDDWAYINRQGNFIWHPPFSKTRSSTSK